MLATLVNAKQTLIAGGVALILGALIAGITVWNIRGNQIDLINKNHEVAELHSQLAVQKAQTSLGEYKLDFEKKLGAKKDELTTTYFARTGRIDRAVANLANVRLQDPHGTGNAGAACDPGTAGCVNGTLAGTGTVLSAEASRFLYSFAGDADKTLEKLRVCKLWNDDVKAELEAYAARVKELQKKND